MALASVFAVGLVLGGCGSDRLTIANRTAVPISPAPGFVVPPCTDVQYGDAELERMRESLGRWALGLVDDWPPPGVARMDAGIPDVPGRSYYLITSSAEPEFLLQPPPPGELPACEGLPAGDFTFG